MAIIFMLIYAKLSNVLSKQALFYATIAPFIIFFGLFATVIYPAREFLHPNALADKLQEILPKGFMGIISVFRNWTFSLFYILSELWGSVALSLLFWGFANDIMKISEAKRFYALLGIGANLALMISGPAIIMASNIRNKLPPEIDAWGVSLKYLMSMVVVAGILVIAIYRWINKNVLTDPRFYSLEDQRAGKKKKQKMSMADSFKFLAKSKYIGLLAILVIAYGISINIVEVTWKSQLKLQYPNSNDYSTFMGTFSTCTGILSVFMMLFVGSNIIRRFGWKAGALFTPIVLSLTGLAFFSFILFKGQLTNVIAFVGTSPLMLAVIIGALQNIMSKSSKYALFDPTKEMAYIPLDSESRVKGKAAIDVVGARLGKAGGAFMQQGLIIWLGSLLAATPYNAAILFVVVIVWMLSAKKLNKLFLEKQTEKEELLVKEEKVEPTFAKQPKKEEEKVPTGV